MWYKYVLYGCGYLPWLFCIVVLITRYRRCWVMRVLHHARGRRRALLCCALCVSILYSYSFVVWVEFIRLRTLSSSMYLSLISYLWTSFRIIEILKHLTCFKLIACDVGIREIFKWRELVYYKFAQLNLQEDIAVRSGRYARPSESVYVL